MHFSEIHAYNSVVIRSKRVQLFLITWKLHLPFFSPFLNYILDYHYVKGNRKSFSSNSEKYGNSLL